ncbi:acyl-CoA-binding domain-containing protein anorexia [Oratosquilla oratoria]|uniref:acyl-CoA-binding domain-containing protein anorexia n=1 Tax=Oratosquilla oratoria TaxID=337810 RepID=UPI003F764142
MDSELSLMERFDRAAGHLRSVADSVPNDKLLYLYGRYKQATEGPCHTVKPGLFDFRGKQKWQAWKDLGNLSKDDAMKEYVDALLDIDPDWESKVSIGGGLKTGWVTVSVLPNTDESINEECKTIFDFVKENNLSKIEKASNVHLNQQDEDGMSPLHWAADRGSIEMVTALLDRSIDINCQDESGQTALHYASSCGHDKIVAKLLERGADPQIADNEGQLPVHCAEEESVIVLFS